MTVLTKTKDVSPAQADIMRIEDVYNPSYGNGAENNGASGNGVHKPSTTNKGVVAPESTDDDIYKYGWRYVKEIDEEGNITYTGEIIPLKQEDLLHPEEEDYHVQNAKHGINIATLTAACDRQLAYEPKHVILSDTLVKWESPTVKPLGPDIAIFLDSDLKGSSPGTYIVGEHGSAPEMVIELSSESTYENDFKKKLRLYEEVGVPYYFIADNVAKDHKFYGYQLTNDGYVAIEPNERGQVWMEPVQMWLDWHEDDGDLIKCYRKDGKPVLTSAEFQRLYDETVEKYEQTKLLLQQESERADQAEMLVKQKAQQVKEERLLKEQEAQRAEQAVQQAEEERLL
ncbi:MAG: Uma2 family endonuclease, partial [Chloroflexota bacterium]